MRYRLRTLLIVVTRVILCGLVTGGVWTALSAILLALIGGEFLAAIPSGPSSVHQNGVPFTFIANLTAGIWAIWLYSTIRPRYASATVAAIVTGLAWWFIVSLQSAKWVALLSIPGHTVAAPLVATLPAIILATMVGAWFYEERISPAL